MRRYLFYLWYILRHKWFVFRAACRLNIPWLGFWHDMSKFLPSEFIPYAEFFYNPDGSPRQHRDKTGYYKPTDTGDAAFDFAWLLHQKRNRHHWQWWVLPEDCGNVKAIEVPLPYLREMVADWLGAGRAQGTPDVQAWYFANKDKMNLHPDTRKDVEIFLFGRQLEATE